MKILRWVLIVAGLIVAAATVFSFFAGSASQFRCDDVAREAQRISNAQGSRINRIEDVTEISHRYGRGESERRCSGRAVLESGQAQTVYMRGYEEGSNVMVSVSPTPFDAAPAQGE